jgi:hypothetical protein
LNQTQIVYKLQMAGIPVFPGDIPYIYALLGTMHRNYLPLKNNQELHKTVPITIVDPKVIQND